MNRRALITLASTGLAPLLVRQAFAADDKAKADDAANLAPTIRMTSEAWLTAAFEPGDFIVAYYLRDPEDKDNRPQVPGGDPFVSGDGGAWAEEKGAVSPKKIPAAETSRSLTHRVLNTSNSQHSVMVDIAALISRKVKEARVSEADAALLVAALLDSKERLNLKDCYSPRHLVLFYDPFGRVKAGLEICFQCESFRVAPAAREGNWDTGDLLTVARLFDKLGLPLGNEKYTLKAYEEFILSERAEEKSAATPEAGANKKEAR